VTFEEYTRHIDWVIRAWGDCVMILATTALRICEMAGLQGG
jgi:hypothetical protein